ncbi:MAG: hypothetical protein MUF84_20330 [Anaerolineae bacterium]|nr:hypothetical protein [Anaerolineae bacterium]
MTGRWSSFLLIVAFGIVLTSYGWVRLLGIEDQTSVSLPRLAQPTAVRGHTSPAQYEELALAAFPARRAAVRVRSLLSAYVFHDPIVGDSVLMGEGGWLFLADEWELNALQKVNAATFTPEAALSGMVRMNDLVRSQGGALFTFVIPNKTTAYAEHIANPVPVLGQSNDAELLVSYSQALPSPISVRWLSEFLDSDIPVYLRTDTHWNDLGAFAAYQEIVRSLGDRRVESAMLQPHDLSRSTRVQAGDLTRMVGLAPEHQENVVRLAVRAPRAVAEAPVDFGCDSGVQTYHVASADLPTALIIHDSFGQAMIPYLAESFSTSWFVHFSLCPQAFYGRLSVVELTRPDYVVVPLVERDFVRIGLWQNPSWMDAPIGTWAR